MTTLTITPDDRPDEILLHTSDFDTIQRELAAIGIPMERWRADAKLAPDHGASNPEWPGPAATMALDVGRLCRRRSRSGDHR